jgi:hypothetical protein
VAYEELRNWPKGHISLTIYTEELGLNYMATGSRPLPTNHKVLVKKRFRGETGKHRYHMSGVAVRNNGMGCLH